MAPAIDRALTQQIRELFDEAGVTADVEVVDGVARLFGVVSSERMRQAAIDLASSLDGVIEIDDQMEYEVVSPDAVYEAPDVDGQFGFADAGAFEDDMSDTEEDFGEGNFAFNVQDVVEEDEIYFPPTDPVVRPGGSTNLEVLGGFQGSSIDEVEAEPADELSHDLQLDGDEGSEEPREDDDLREAVVRELLEDALTTDLDLTVDVVNGIVILRGVVPTIEDAENAEAVASRVPGIREVRDLTEIRGS